MYEARPQLELLGDVEETPMFGACEAAASPTFEAELGLLARFHVQFAQHAGN